MRVPRNNTGAVYGAVLITVAVFVLTDLLNFFNSGAPLPTDMNGWLHLVVPSVLAGLLASLTPHYSLTERSTGLRIIDSSKDAPVLDTNPSQIVVNPSQPPLPILSPTIVTPTSPGVPPAHRNPQKEV